MSLPFHINRPSTEVKVAESRAAEILAALSPEHKDDFAWVFFRWLHIRFAPLLPTSIAQLHDELSRTLFKMPSLTDWLYHSPVLALHSPPPSILPTCSLQYRCWQVLLLHKFDVSAIPSYLLSTAPRLPSLQGSLLRIHPKEFARQLTMFLLFLVRRISTSDWFDWNRQSPKPTAGPVHDLSMMSRRLQMLVESTVITAGTAELRAVAYNYFFQVMFKLMKHRNVHSMTVMLSGLRQKSVSRLDIRLPKKIASRSLELIELVSPDCGYQTLWRYLKAQPSVPPISVYLTEFIYTKEGHPRRRNNIRLVDKYGDIVSRLRGHSESPSHQIYWPVLPIISAVLFFPRLDEEELYQLSLRIKPRRPCLPSV